MALFRLDQQYITTDRIYTTLRSVLELDFTFFALTRNQTQLQFRFRQNYTLRRDIHTKCEQFLYRIVWLLFRKNLRNTIFRVLRHSLRFYPIEFDSSKFFPRTRFRTLSLVFNSLSSQTTLGESGSILNLLYHCLSRFDQHQNTWFYLSIQLKVSTVKLFMLNIVCHSIIETIDHPMILNQDQTYN